MNKKIFILAVIILAIIGGYGFVRYAKPAAKGVSLTDSSTPKYKSQEYGFSFSLPEDWKGYSVVTETWEGDPIDPNGSIERGPMISLRDPNWTEKDPHQDIPIMVFTVDQWNSLQQEKFHIGAAPIGPSELGRNSKYVFALPARYNYAFLKGWEEVDNILKNDPLKIF